MSDTSTQPSTQAAATSIVLSSQPARVSPETHETRAPPTVTAVTRARATTEASGPKAPPVSQVGAPARAVLTAIEPPRSPPETAAPNR